MSARSLHLLIGKAVISESFRAGLLNGQRAELLREFDLDPQEVAALLAIRADTLKDFAAQVEQLASSHSADSSPSRIGGGRVIGGARAQSPGGEWGATSENHPNPS